MSLDVSPIGIIAGATSTALSIYQTIQAGIEKKRIREEYDAYNPMDIKNPYAGMDKAPTDAYQLRSDANARALATGASVSQMAGRGLSTMPQLTNQYSQQEAALGADLAQYAYNVDVRMGQGEQMRQGMEFERENRYLEGLAGGYGQASANMNDAMVGIGSGLVSLGSEMDAAGVFDGSKSVGAGGATSNSSVGNIAGGGSRNTPYTFSNLESGQNPYNSNLTLDQPFSGVMTNNKYYNQYSGNGRDLKPYE